MNPIAYCLVCYRKLDWKDLRSLVLNTGGELISDDKYFLRQVFR